MKLIIKYLDETGGQEHMHTSVCLNDFKANFKTKHKTVTNILLYQQQQYIMTVSFGSENLNEDQLALS